MINGDEKVLDRKMSVADLVKHLELDVKKIAIEKDLEIVPLEQFAKVMLEEGCRVEIVHFIGGG